MANSPKQPDTFVGTVYGNVLDKFDNIAYNLKLYMIPPSAYVSGNYTAPTNETVVLAQTGVTGNQIDNLQITTQEGPGKAFIPVSITFDIIQPGAANFLDQIIATKAKIGAPVFANDVPLFLEIAFRGYSDDIEEVDNGGKLQGVNDIAGPFRYRLILSTVSLEIDEKGSVYNVECVVAETTAYNDDYYTLPATITVSGKTIPEYIENLTTHLADYREANNTEYGIKDVVNFDLSDVIDKIGIDLVTNTSERAEEINRIMNPELLNVAPDEYEDILESNQKDEGTLDIIVDEDRITFREGITMETVFSTILSMSDEFFSKLVRTENPEDPEGEKEVDKGRSFVKWFRINASAEYIDFDYNRNRYAKTITYRPTIFNAAGDQVQFSAAEQTGLTKNDVQSRFDGMVSNVFKSYHYLFTGRNDQIINCRIAYNAGHSLLLAPARGVRGDFSTVNAPGMKSSASIDKDLTHQKEREAAEAAANQQTAGEAFDSLQDSGDIRALGNTLGLTDAEIQEAQSDSSSQSARILKNILADKQLAAAARAAIQAQKNNTQSDNVRNTTNSPIYSADIIDSVSERMDSASTLAAARARVTEIRTAFRNNPEASPDEVAALTDNQNPSIQQAYVTNPTEAATYDGTARNSIFGYVMQQHSNQDFLVKLNMEIKGDPFYLGEPNRITSQFNTSPASYPDGSKPDWMDTTRSENYIMFEMQTPRLFDYDVDNDDNNTGYWTPAGTAYFISGMYKARGVVSSFSGGLFSQELDLYKIVPIRLSQLDKAKAPE